MIKRIKENLLKRFKAEKPFRAIIMISINIEKKQTQGRQTPEERKAAINEVIQSAEQALPEIDRVLKQNGGRRLTSPNALGTVTVETTRKGFKELESLECVSSIIEDQPVSLIQ